MDNHFRTIQLDDGTYMYNLTDEPGEQNNLADNYPKKIDKLYKAHESWKNKRNRTKTYSKHNSPI